MTGVVCDASVVLKWFHSEGEPDIAHARTIYAAHRTRTLRAHVLDLTVYEVGNVLIRRLGWDGATAAAQLDDLMTICGPVARLGTATRGLAAELAALHRLTFYDAAYWAVATALDFDLVTYDAELVRAGGGEEPAAFCARLGLATAP